MKVKMCLNTSLTEVCEIIQRNRKEGKGTEEFQNRGKITKLQKKKKTFKKK